MARLKGINSNLAAFLDMLAWSEGTEAVKGSDDGYNVIVGGSLFNNYIDHPRLLVDLPKLKIKSSAAGRYQVLARYYDAYKKTMGLKEFSPENQDRIAIQQISEQKALNDIIAGNITAAINRCSNIWASLPGNGYGQHQHKIGDLISIYKRFGGK